jgi:hypothetical protein
VGIVSLAGFLTRRLRITGWLVLFVNRRLRRRWLRGEAMEI